MSFQSGIKIVADVNSRTETYSSRIADKCHRESTLTNTNLRIPDTVLESKNIGKVRDVYRCKDFVIMVATDRQSAFDRQLTSIPFKGQVLNKTSIWWFTQTAHLVPNHIISSPHANVTVGKKCTVFPIEFVMRGYLTGSTSTSIWTNYNAGMRYYCGHNLPEGMVKNQQLSSNLLTPTTKDDAHDELISADEIVSTGRMSHGDFDQCAQYAHALFAHSQSIALEKGLILVDTKYEFGRDAAGNILLIDEIQTPDSSRYWVKSSYADRMASSQEPENIDKEFLRRWYVEKCDPYNDQVLPSAPLELVCELSRRYIMIYEILTGEEFSFDDDSQEAMDAALREWGWGEGEVGDLAGV